MPLVIEAGCYVATRDSVVPGASGLEALSDEGTDVVTRTRPPSLVSPVGVGRRERVTEREVESGGPLGGKDLRHENPLRDPRWSQESSKDLVSGTGASSPGVPKSWTLR